MSATEKYHQCRLTRGESECTAWIPERGAKEGVQIELGGRGGKLWTVAHVYGIVALSKADLDERERDSRKATPSVRVIR